MAHPQQAEFVAYCRLQYPQNFKDCKVLEVGSLDINGSIRDFFTDCQYIGVDLGEGQGGGRCSPRGGLGLRQQ
jgi:hypothetical protein